MYIFFFFFGLYIFQLPLGMLRSGKGRRTYFDKFVSQHLSGAGSSPSGSISRYLNSEKLHY